MYLAICFWILIISIRPPKLTWNLEMMVSNRNLLFQGSIFRFHVCFGGVYIFISVIFLGKLYIFSTSHSHRFQKNREVLLRLSNMELVDLATKRALG